MSGERLGSADRNLMSVISEDLLDRHRFGAVVELGRTGVRVDVIDLLGRELRVGQSVYASRECMIRQWAMARSCEKRRCSGCSRATSA